MNISVNLEKFGNHTLKVYPVDPGVDLQKIIIKTGEVEESYLGAAGECQGAG